MLQSAFYHVGSSSSIHDVSGIARRSHDGLPVAINCTELDRFAGRVHTEAFFFHQLHVFSCTKLRRSWYLFSFP